MAYDALAFGAFAPTEESRVYHCTRCFTQHRLAPSDRECPSCGAPVNSEGSNLLGSILSRLAPGGGAAGATGAAEGASGGDGAAPAAMPPGGLLALLGMLGQGIPGMTGVPGMPGLPTAPGDAVADEDMDELMGRLMDQFGGGGGAPPASAKSVAGLPVIELEDPKDLPAEVGLRITGFPGELLTVPAAFGPSVTSPGLTAPLVVAEPLTAHPEITNASSLSGAIAIIKRGGCSFAHKIRRAQAAGAVAVIVVQNVGVFPYTMTDSATNGEGITIPAVLVKLEVGDRIVERAASESKSDDMSASLLVKASSTLCVVCQCTYEAGDTLVRLPCQHLFHKECIKGWLKQRNTCCVCRMELPTDDPEYERRKNKESETEAFVNSMFL